MTHNRRSFLKAATIGSSATLLSTPVPATESLIAKPVQVLIWDERQQEQKQAYTDFLGNELAKHLMQQPGIEVRSVSLNDADQGINESLLSNSDVLIWWGHQRQDELLPEKALMIVDRILEGKLSLIALHSAHWSMPFVEAMNQRTKQDVLKTIKDPANTEVSYIGPAEKYKAPQYDSRLTPYTISKKFPNGKQNLQVHMPNCCFPAYGKESQPSTVKLLMPSHPVAKGLPAEFIIPQTEMYDEPFHVPEPDEVILEERWPTGEWFRSAMSWKLGRGKVFYFRPGHEIYPVYRQEWPLRVVLNAVRWLGKG
jgi:trehalose utilization protein